ncbi:MAG: energy-coupling factor transporter transmembrane protein EcfT [Treponema sp.]|jgi:energy-coupling factor transporter transmembrane protein EcfT|nr:energy-coupling factor transporter transmembrane protein EcfT [Treponema sp.]
MYLNRLDITHDVLRRFDPRARVIAGVSLILVSIHLTHYTILAGIIAASMLLLRRDLFPLIKRLAPLEVFCALFLPQALCGLLPGRMAIVFILRIHCAAFLYMLTVASMGFGAFTQALAALRVNPKLISILYLTHRYIYMMGDTVFLAVKAMRFRKNANNNGLIFIWKSYAAVFAASLCAAYVKAESAGAALLSRGFDGLIPQTSVRRWGVADSVLVGSCLVSAGIYGTYTLIKHFFFV